MKILVECVVIVWIRVKLVEIGVVSWVLELKRRMMVPCKGWGKGERNRSLYRTKLE